MNLSEVREEIVRLNFTRDIETATEYLEFFIQCLYDIIMNHKKGATDSDLELNARLILQMIFSKLIHLNKLLEGVGFTNKKGTQLINPILDPTIITTLVRSIYEQVCLFNLIYSSTDSKDKRTLVFQLWQSSGLKYRQRFAKKAKSPENIEKARQEKAQIVKIEEDILSNPVYLALNEKNQNKIQGKLKNMDFKIKIEDMTVRYLNWQEISAEFSKEHGFFDTMYTYFSLYTHPSYVSVFQFRDMFSVEGEEFKEITEFNLRRCLALISLFLKDYITFFPDVINTFQDRDILDQVILDFYNRMLRGEEYAINEAWKEMG